MPYIQSIHAIQILDSRGNPTIEVHLTTDEGISTKASVPSGASTGKHEAVELRDNDTTCYLGKGVLQAVSHVNGPLADLLTGKYLFDQSHLDQLMIQADGTPNKSRLGANAILGVSLAIARAAALSAKLPLYRYIGGCHAFLLPCPMMNIINGGSHADNSIDFQEFMIRPIGADTLAEAVRWGTEIFHTLKKILKERKLSTSIGDEGGFAPDLASDEAVLQVLLEAIEKAGYRPGEQVTIALDCAASEFFEPMTGYYVEKKRRYRNLPFNERTSSQQISYLAELCKKYPIDSIEDALDEGDWAGWKLLTQELGNQVQLVGDDLFVTNKEFLNRGIKEQISNAILIKPNQIGTLTETLETIRLAQNGGFATIISHRSGETEDAFIADLSVAVNAGQIKTGSLCRTDRVAKYNRLMHIEETLKETALYGDSNKYRCRYIDSHQKIL